MSDSINDVLNNSFDDALSFILNNNIPSEKFDKNIKSIYRYHIINNICRYLIANNLKIVFYNTDQLIFKYFKKTDIIKLIEQIFKKLNMYLPIIISDKSPTDPGIKIELRNLLESNSNKIINFNKLRKFINTNNISSLNDDLVNSLKFRQFFS